MSLFADQGIETVPHFAPLHYLPFIARARSLKSKPVLAADGFPNTHFRSKSKRHDVDRGFGEYAFLTLSHNPRIVIAKLKGGFPHIAINTPVEAFEDVSFDLCRYNVAMARRLPTSPLGGFPPSETNGRYYGNKALPIARNNSDKKRLLEKHYPAGTMIEVLVKDQLPLPDDTTITCYSVADRQLAEEIVRTLDVPWRANLIVPPGVYNRSTGYARAVQDFVQKALADPNWRGNGIEFDRV